MPTEPENASLVRLFLFFGIFFAMALAETLLPKRDRREPRTPRWLTHFGMVFLSSLAVMAVFPIAAVGAALWTSAKGYGLFNAAGLDPWLSFILTFVLLDLAIYVQHVATHKIPLLWRLHRVHHADHDLDASSGIRFHPIEIVLSVAYKILIVIALGAPAFAVFVFEAVLNGASLFNHANLRMPRAMDGILRLIVVTPDMHRVHHSVERHETDANYGFNLSVWDRLFGTYVDQPEKGHGEMTIGLPDQQGEGPSGLWWSLVFPFRRDGRGQ